MRALVEIALALLAVLGLLTLGWILFGHALTPIGCGKTCTVVPASGDAPELEQAVTGLLWLRGGGLLHGSIVIADYGLSAAGKAIAAALSLREPGILFCSAAELSHSIGKL